MSSMSLPGGERLVSDRMPRGYFDEMASMLWKIGNQAVGHALYDAPTPSEMIADTIIIDNYGLDLRFTFQHNDITGTSEPVIYTGIVAEHEPYTRAENATICEWRQFILNTRTRRKEFLRGMSVMVDGAEIVLKDGHPNGRYSHQEPRIWRQAAQLDKTCTLDDYEDFMTGLYIVHEGLKLQSAHGYEEDDEY